MMWSLALIVVVMLVSVGFTGLCTFNPGAPESGPVREVDAEAFMSLEARAMAFPLRLPDNPDGWVTNSARRTQVNSTPAPVVGWVTSDNGFIQATQTDQPLDDSVRTIDQDLRQLERTEQIAGTEVQIHGSDASDIRDLWAMDLGETRVLFTGAGTDEEFHTLIEAFITAEPLPAN